MTDIYKTTQEGYLEFSPGFFQQCMRDYLEDPGIVVTAVRYVGEVGVTATTRMKYTGERDKLLGLFRYGIDYTQGGRPRSIEILVKSKTHYLELVQRLGDVLIKSGIQVPGVAGLLGKTELFNTHIKEINVFRMQKTDPAFTRVLPIVYGTYANDAVQQYVVLEEFLANAYVMKDYRDISFWSPAQIETGVRDFSRMHAAHFGKYETLVGEGWLGKTLDAGVMRELTPLWSAYAEKLRHYIGTLFDAEYLDTHRQWIDTIPQWWGAIDAQKKTLIFNDAQIRNLAVRDPYRDPRLVLFDWECASIQLPQRDLVEFLSYAIGEGTTDAEIAGYLEAARHQLAESAQVTIDPREWLTGCRYSIRDLHVNRMACQLVLHITLNRPDIERVFRASLRILACVERSLTALGVALEQH
ncbi:MAG: phosphotransferase [Burkholderiales bacterium]